MTPVLLIAAVASNGVIGRDNALLWRLKSDMAGFRAATLGKPVVMGRKTFESLGRPLPRRLNIVVTRHPGLSLAGAVVASGLDVALAVARAETLRSGATEIVVMGGAEIYAQAMAFADRLLITHVEAAPDGDTFFPLIDLSVWAGRDISAHPAGPVDDYAFRVVEYRRAARSA
ncbi:dihydrofolate reductase [Phreatobacter stygius]|uniref:Dihydrofolate reductase n=1 Tax=Phreatobacter stygius TaxID=1940610 RepID=A0A4D7B5W6_9HYPH|nr:dihydrofolate reductase [Phreatobacter stygius]QCI65788.1 dihydrofolate reductase [Phreatobacter stygius]